MTAYYNEIDPYAAQWLRNLIAAGHIAPGDVDERSIEDVHPDDLRGYVQCHFFAGIGIWSYALRRAGWADDRPVWTGSCPCQPFSAAGKGAGFDDERHLWPHWHWLIQERRPAKLFGEQVASGAVEPWIDLVHADLEALGYAFGCVPFPAAGVGAPHIRDRAYWVANAECQRVRPYGRGQDARPPRSVQTADEERQRVRADVGQCGGIRRLADAQQRDRGCQAATAHHVGSKTDGSADRACGCGGASCRLGHAGIEGLAQRIGFPGVPGRSPGADPGQALERAGLHAVAGPGPVNGHWADADWLLCRDGKWRPAEPGTFPLAHGAPQRVGRLRAYGNGIVAQAAEAFIRAALGPTPASKTEGA
ncbi:DNA cytosine methyltransferase [Pigmentiphaga daeguensis]|uniref:DNA cytosine methyltransferase n=1 Tax=Pigmentiphaga daeguensis TaxID=414049 RepID=UPI0031D869DC